MFVPCLSHGGYWIGLDFASLYSAVRKQKGSDMFLFVLALYSSMLDLNMSFI